MHFQYADFWDKDEEIFQSAQNMTSLRKRFKENITIVGGKGKATEQLKSQEEKASKKRQEEDHGLAQET